MATRKPACAFFSLSDTSKIGMFPKGFEWVTGSVFQLASTLRGILTRWLDSTPPAARKASSKIHKKRDRKRKAKRLKVSSTAPSDTTAEPDADSSDTGAFDSGDESLQLQLAG